MQIFQSLRDLKDDMTAQILAEICQPDDLMEQLASRGKLQDNVVVLTRFGKVDELYNGWMIDLPHDLHLFENVRSLSEKCKSVLLRSMLYKT